MTNNKMLEDEFENWFINLGDDRMNGKYPCTICKYCNDGYCPACNWMEPEFNILKCRKNTLGNF